MNGAAFNRLAERELDEAFEYYESESAGLGERFLEEVRHAVILLSRYPEAAPAVRGAVRRFVLPRFPYSLLYRPLGPGAIRILALAHQKRRPEYWSRRH